MDWVPYSVLGHQLDRRSALDAAELRRRVYQATKRWFDVLFSLSALLLTSPAIALIALLVRLSGRGGVIYAHKRIGQGNKIIHVLKFRTMVSDADAYDKYFTAEQKARFFRNFKLDDDPRITPIGKWLRKTSLDELPQLVNILRGELSLVGPRPIVQREMDAYYSRTAPLLTSVRPGLTGYWQANGRSDTEYPQRADMELHYVRNCSWKMDLRILGRTALAVLQRRGAK